MALFARAKRGRWNVLLPVWASAGKFCGSRRKIEMILYPLEKFVAARKPDLLQTHLRFEGSRLKLLSAVPVPWLLLALLAGAILGSSVSGVAAAMPQREAFAGTTMGSTPYNVIVEELPTGIDRQRVQRTIDSELESVNQGMSTYIPESDVSRFNAANSTDWIEVASATAEVVRRALEISRQTEGAFDITVGPLVNRWRFGPDKDLESFELPSDNELQQLMALTGYKALSVRLDPPAIKKDRVGIQIDLSAIAKGYAVDQVCDALIALGCQSVMVEVGGEVRVEGLKLDGSKWRLGINDPRAMIASRIYAIAELDGRAMATSGDYRNFFDYQGKRYSHTIDPRTGWPVENQVTSATVVAADCLTADALATAVMVLGFERADELGQSNDWGAEMFVLERQDASSEEFAEKVTGGFPLTVDPAEPAGAESAKGLAFLPMLAITFGFFIVVLVAMSVGVIFSNRRIKGSCGGLAALEQLNAAPGTKISCSMCSNPSEQCKELKEAMKRKAAAEQ